MLLTTPSPLTLSALLAAGRRLHGSGATCSVAIVYTTLSSEDGSFSTQLHITSAQQVHSPLKPGAFFKLNTNTGWL